MSVRGGEARAWQDHPVESIGRPPASLRRRVEGATTTWGPPAIRPSVFQQDTVIRCFRVRENLEFGLTANKLPEGEQNEISSLLAMTEEEATTG